MRAEPPDRKPILGPITRILRLASALLLAILGLFTWGDVPASPVQADPAPVPEALNTNADTDSGADTSVRLAADDSGALVAVWSSDDSLGGTIGTDGDILYARSADGIEWSAPAPLNTTAGSDTDLDQAPDVVSAGGTVIAAWHTYGFAGIDPEVWFRRSTDGGITWSPQAFLDVDATADSFDDIFPRLVGDGAGNWVAVWYTDADGDYDIVAARSTDDGFSWSTPVLVNDFGTADGTTDIGPVIATDGEGVWIAAWHSRYDGGTGSDQDIWFARSLDGGMTWSTATPLNDYALTDAMDEGYAPAALTSASGGVWIAAWQSFENIGGAIGTDADILYTRSTNDGLTWSSAAALNPDAPTDAENDGHVGSIAVISNGDDHLAALWAREEVGTGAFDVLGARSINDGITWDPPVSLTRADGFGAAIDIRPAGTYGAGSWIFAWESQEDIDGIIGTDYDILRHNCLGDSRLDCLRDLPRLIVDDTGDGSDSTAGDGACATAGVVCTLRAAIQESNALGGTRIYFRIAGAGPHVISPASALPALTAPAVIDGMTEPGFMGTPVVRIDGSSLAGSNGLEVTGGTSTVKGLSITGFTGGSGVYAHSGNSNVVTGNFLGIAPDGTTGAGNENGVMADSTSVIRVGGPPGPTAYERNVVSGNSQVGVAMLGVSEGEIEGNFIGTNAAGTSAVANGTGILIAAVSADIIVTSNVLSGNTGSGLNFAAFAGTGHIVRRNLIGTAAAMPLGNGGDGIRFVDGTDNLIGGGAAGDGNIIWYNGGDGVLLEGSSPIRNTIRGNSISSNAGKGIENLSGGNTELAPPVITISLPDSTFGTACANCIVDVYSDPADEGVAYVGSTTADGSGNWGLMATPVGPNLTATATDSVGNTSEFSASAPLGDADSDLIPDASEGECGDSIDSDGNGFVNDGCPQVGATAESGAECSNSVDDDGDGWVNDGCPSMGTEGAACHSMTGAKISRPERVDGGFAGLDDDGDGDVDEPLPAGAEAFDCDGDGYTGAAEAHVYSYVPQADGDQKTCMEYDLSHPNPNADTKPSLRWPSDFSKTTGILDSLNRINVLDITSFLAPVKYMGTDVGTNAGDVRWDLVPGKGIFPTDININDLTSLIAGASGSPPMLGGARAFGSPGPLCPWPE